MNERQTAADNPRAPENLGRFAFIIPAYNHAATVAQVARKARDMGFPVFVVDDGSTDDTPQRLAEIKNI
ncbi:MAG: glycosyltransferase, partial [Deltaproteobacteria bacterium]